MSSGVKNFSEENGVVVGIAWLYLQFSFSLSFPNFEISEMKTPHCEVVHGAHPSVSTAGSTAQLFFEAFFSVREMESKFLFSGTSVGDTDLLCLKVPCIQQEESLLQ